MKVLLDEMIPHPLRHLISPHDVYTVAFMKWDGLKNGRLLAAAANAGFDAMITRDRGLPFQQNAVSLPLALIVLRGRSETLEDILPWVPRILAALNGLTPRATTFID